MLENLVKGSQKILSVLQMKGQVKRFCCSTEKPTSSSSTPPSPTPTPIRSTAAFLQDNNDNIYLADDIFTVPETMVTWKPVRRNRDHTSKKPPVHTAYPSPPPTHFTNLLAHESAFSSDEDTVSQHLVPFYEVVLTNGVASYEEKKISKYVLSYESGMPLRDLRPFTHLLNRKLQVPQLVTRPRSFLINMEPLQSIVMHDRLRVFNVEPDEVAYMSTLIRKLERPSVSAFEHRALETVLAITVKKLEHETNAFDGRLTFVLDNATRNPTSQNLWDLRVISDEIEAHGAYVHQTLSAVSQVLGREDEMQMMYLSNYLHGIDTADFREVELILEAAEDRLQALDHSVAIMRTRITNAEEFLQVWNDTRRNEIIRITLYATLVALGFSAVSAVASTFGMNLVSSFESDPNMFAYVVVSMSVVFASVLLNGAIMIKRINKDKPITHSTPKSF